MACDDSSDLWLKAFYCVLCRFYTTVRDLVTGTGFGVTIALFLDHELGRGV
jgi:hypothetical protein